MQAQSVLGADFLRVCVWFQDLENTFSMNPIFKPLILSRINPTLF